MTTKRIAIFTLVFAMMVTAFGVVSAHDGNGNGKRGGRGFGNADSTILTNATGLEHAEIREAVRNGSTIADLIVANGGDVNATIILLVDEATDQVNAKLEAGDITQERADEILATLEDRITERVNGTFEPDGRRGRRGSRGLDDLAEESITEDDA